MKHIPNFVTTRLQGAPAKAYEMWHLEQIAVRGQTAVLITEDNTVTVIQDSVVQFSTATEEMVNNLNEYMRLLVMQHNAEVELLAIRNQQAELEEKLHGIRQQRQILKEDLAGFGGQKSQQPKTVGDLLALYVRTN